MRPKDNTPSPELRIVASVVVEDGGLVWWPSILRRDQLGADPLRCVFCDGDASDDDAAMLSWWESPAYEVTHVGLYCGAPRCRHLARSALGILRDAHVRQVAGERARVEVDRILRIYPTTRDAAERLERIGEALGAVKVAA